MLEKDKHYTEHPASTWSKLVDIEKEHKPSYETGWIFKGLTDSKYPLLTTLERDVANIHGIDPNDEGKTKDINGLLEKGLLYPEFNKGKNTHH